MDLDWSQCPVVERDPQRLSGAVVFRGTRMPVSPVFENLQEGAGIDDMVRWFGGISREQMKTVLKFAAKSAQAPPKRSA